MMRNLIFSINLTLDGFIDHTVMVADDELHEKASELLRRADVILFGRKAYQLMAEAWPKAPADKSLSPRVREFAETINAMEKIVYSTTLKSVSWKTTILRSMDPAAILAMKRLPGKDMLLGPGASIAQTFMRYDLIDEYRFLIHPIILGGGIPLFTGNDKRKEMVLAGYHPLRSGVVELIYHPKNPPADSQTPTRPA